MGSQRNGPRGRKAALNTFHTRPYGTGGPQRSRIRAHCRHALSSTLYASTKEHSRGDPTAHSINGIETARRRLFENASPNAVENGCPVLEERMVRRLFEKLNLSCTAPLILLLLQQPVGTREISFMSGRGAESFSDVNLHIGCANNSQGLARVAAPAWPRLSE
eukprot:6183094-Pleurochrysis_carterae.AAC.2